MKTPVTACAVSVVVLFLSSPVWSQAVLPELKKQPSAQAVLHEHLDALNHCDWNRLVAQFPDDAQVNLPGGTIIKGRKGIGDLFTVLCKDPKDGGLKGITLEPEQTTAIGDTFVTQWVVTAPFLAEPYKGSDAYVTKDGYMQAMVTTFDGTALKMRK
jgi:hypothetical protein